MLSCKRTVFQKRIYIIIIIIKKGKKKTKRLSQDASNVSIEKEKRIGKRKYSKISLMTPVTLTSARVGFPESSAP